MDDLYTDLLEARPCCSHPAFRNTDTTRLTLLIAAILLMLFRGNCCVITLSSISERLAGSPALKRPIRVNIIQCVTERPLFRPWVTFTLE